MTVLDILMKLHHGLLNHYAISQPYSFINESVYLHRVDKFAFYS